MSLILSILDQWNVGHDAVAQAVYALLNSAGAADPVHGAANATGTAAAATAAASAATAASSAASSAPASSAAASAAGPAAAAAARPWVPSDHPPRDADGRRILPPGYPPMPGDPDYDWQKGDAIARDPYGNALISAAGGVAVNGPRIAVEVGAEEAAKFAAKKFGSGIASTAAKDILMPSPGNGPHNGVDIYPIEPGEEVLPGGL